MSYPKQTYAGGPPPAGVANAPPTYNEAVNNGYQHGGDAVVINFFQLN